MPEKKPSPSADKSNRTRIYVRPEDRELAKERAELESLGLNLDLTGNGGQQQPQDQHAEDTKKKAQPNE